MNKDEQGYHIHGHKLAHWSALLEEWLTLIKRYCRYMEDDLPYCWSERSNIGVLAAAAWRAGWVALEEFGNKRRAQRHGRSDLYIYPCDRDKGEFIEAKQAWSINGARNALGRSEEDAKCLDQVKSNLYIGVAFVSPIIQEKYEQDIDNKIQQIITTALNINCDGVAWSFPVNARSLKFVEQGKPIIYPGVLLLAKVAREV
jgi:hypothetical protein